MKIKFTNAPLPPKAIALVVNNGRQWVITEKQLADGDLYSYYILDDDGGTIGPFATHYEAWDFILQISDGE